MKKVLSVLLALSLVLCFAVSLAEEAEANVKTGHYQLVNTTGENVKRITVTDNVTGDSLQVDFFDEMLSSGETAEVSFSIPDGEDGEHRLTLEFETESGKIGTFKTLSIEDVSINLLDVDTVAGATPIKFAGSLGKMGRYMIVNKTGAVVKTLKITDNVSNNALIVNTELPADGETLMTFTIGAEEDGEHRLTFTFIGEDGAEHSFPTLSIEDVTINLLAADAMTGATPVQFGPYAPAEKEAEAK